VHRRRWGGSDTALLEEVVVERTPYDGSGVWSLDAPHSVHPGGRVALCGPAIGGVWGGVTECTPRFLGPGSPHAQPQR
jgi:hypothetical protein